MLTSSASLRDPTETSRRNDCKQRFAGEKHRGWRFPDLEDSPPVAIKRSWRIAASSIRSDPMTQSAEDCARAILKVFSSQDVRAGHALMYSAVNVQFPESYSAEDFAAGLAYAIDREWLSNENTMIRLTQSGFDESQKLK